MPTGPTPLSHSIRIELDPEPGAERPSRDEMDRWLEAGKGGFSTEQLQEAFQKVRDSEHWKNDIDAVVPAEMKDILIHAIPWHTGGGEVEFHDLGDGSVRVIAPGYWTNGMDG